MGQLADGSSNCSTQFLQIHACPHGRTIHFSRTSSIPIVKHTIQTLGFARFGDGGRCSSSLPTSFSSASGSAGSILPTLLRYP